MEKRVATNNLKLPKEIIAEILEYLYYTPEQIALREKYKRVHFSIKNAITDRDYLHQTRYYLFHYKHIMIYICFCKCGNYKFSSDIEYCVLCRC
jgi:hypothetical protein